MVTFALLIPLLLPPPHGRPPQAAGAEVAVLNRGGAAVTHITDGDRIRLQARLAVAAGAATLVTFTLDPDSLPTGACTVAAGHAECATEPFMALGWHWSAGGQAAPRRTVTAATASGPLASAGVDVAARPVVMVHGFVSSAKAWESYLGAAGFLASIGVPAYAVGDGQAPGTLNTGSLTTPSARTNTIAENAAVLRDYIAGVKAATGAETVDLLGHSMGGLISRYYLDRLMADRDVGLLIMLGTPHAGSDCAALPAALDLYLPATIEIRPQYVSGVFDRQITHRRGVPFYAVAGTAILEPFKAPCTGVPSDIAVSLGSAEAIPVHLSESPLLHVDLNNSPEVFADYVRPLLAQPAGKIVDEPDPAPAAGSAPPLQFTRVFTGHVPAGESVTHTIDIEAGVAVASFALFDPTRSLTVTVHGASGNIVALSADKNGLRVVDDPGTLVYLGYGFDHPKPGPWQVTLLATDRTPAAGADYAITAQLAGGVELSAETSNLLPIAGEAVEIRARLTLGGQSLPVTAARAVIRGPDGLLTAPLHAEGDAWQLRWAPATPGLYALDVLVIGQAPDGTPVARTAFLSVEAQPSAAQAQGMQSSLALIAGGAGVVVLALVAVMIARRARRQASPPL
jgi:pimeloyl-ACP methyl ester carboxylesterase